MAIRKTTSYKRNNKASGKKLALSKIADSITLYDASDKVYMKYSNISHHTANRPKTYNCRGKEQFKTREDFQREFNRLHDFLYGNMQANNKCKVITLKIRDKRITSVDKAYEIGKAYCKSIPEIKYYAIRVELDCNHHPHLHIMLRVKHELKDLEYESRWQYGEITVQKFDGNRERLCNYLIKVPKTDDFAFDKGYAEELAKKEELLSKQLQAINHKYREVKTKSIGFYQLRSIYRKTKKQKKRVHSRLKEVLQYQFCLGDSDLRFSYGSRKSIKRIPNKDQKTEKDLCDQYGLTYHHSVTYLVRFVDDKIGEIVNTCMNSTDVYTRY